MRFFDATLSHETNRFSPIPTSLDSYREFYLYLPSTGEGADILNAPMEGVNLHAAIERRGHEAICGLAASAQPSRPTCCADYEHLRNELIANLQSAGPIDAVALFLHGAQLADGYDDCEGDILSHIRDVVGPDIPIGVMLDLHGNITDKMLAAADLLIACKEYPHFDFEDRAEQLIVLLERMVRKEITPVQHLARAPMIGTYFTTSEPMRTFVDELYAYEHQGEALAMSVCHGFAPADITDAGASVIAITDGSKERAQEMAETTAQKLFDMRQAIATPFVSCREAISQALAASEGPVIIADVTDNPGGGAPGDSTFLLREMITRNVTGAAVAMIWDPEAASLAVRAGEGARLSMRIGGKLGPTSGAPLDVEAKVLCIRTDAYQIGQSMRCPFGLAAAVDIGGIEVVLYSLRNQTFTPHCFTEFGIDPTARRILVVKSQQHFYEHFSAITKKVIYATPPGTVDMALKLIPLRNVRLPAWPLDEPPFSAFGRIWK